MKTIFTFPFPKLLIILVILIGNLNLFSQTVTRTFPDGSFSGSTAIADAINDAETTTGSVLTCSAGTYTGGFIISKQILLNGPFAGSDARGRTAGGSDARIDVPVGGGTGIIISSPNVTIDGMYFEGNATVAATVATHVAISYITTSGNNISGIKIKNNIIQNFKNQGIVLTGVTGSTAGSGNEISHNLIQNIYNDNTAANVYKGTNAIIGCAVVLKFNQFADVLNNKISNGWGGVFLSFFSVAGTANINNNTILVRGNITGSSLPTNYGVGVIIFNITGSAATIVNANTNNITQTAASSSNSFPFAAGLVVHTVTSPAAIVTLDGNNIHGLSYFKHFSGGLYSEDMGGTGILMFNCTSQSNLLIKNGIIGGPAAADGNFDAMACLGSYYDGSATSASAPTYFTIDHIKMQYNIKFAILCAPTANSSTNIVNIMVTNTEICNQVAIVAPAVAKYNSPIFTGENTGKTDVSITLDNCYIHNNVSGSGYFIAFRGGNNVIIKNSTFTSTGPISLQSRYGISSKTFIQNNIFNSVAIYIDDYGSRMKGNFDINYNFFNNVEAIHPYGSATTNNNMRFNASFNYWGTTVTEAGVQTYCKYGNTYLYGTSGGTNIDYSPWLTTATNMAPQGPPNYYGFIPDFSNIAIGAQGANYLYGNVAGILYGNAGAISTVNRFQEAHDAMPEGSTIKVYNNAAFTETDQFNVNKSGTLSLVGTVIGTTSIASTLNMNAVTKTLTINPGVSPSLTVSALTLTDGTINVGTGTLLINGAVSQTNGTLNSSATGTVNYAQPSTGQYVAAGNYGILTFSDYNKILSSGIINIAGTFNPGAATGHTVSGNTINFNGSSTQNIPAFNFNNLSIANTGVVTLANSGTIGIGGNFVPGTATYTITGSTISFNGTEAQTIPTFNGATGYNILQINNSSGASLNGNVKAANGLNLTNGIITTGSNNLTLGTNIVTNGSATSFVEGNLGLTLSTASSTDITYPMGAAGIYRPFNFNIAQNTGTPTVYTASVVNANGNSIRSTFSGGIDKVSPFCYYTLAKGAGANLMNTVMTINYNPDDLVNENTKLRIAQDDGTNWASRGGTGSSNSTGSITSSSITNLNNGNFILANDNSGKNFTYADAVYVSTSGDDGNDGLTSITAKRTIIAGLGMVASGGMLFIAEGTSYGEDVNINKAVVINGKTADFSGAGNPTTTSITLNVPLGTSPNGLSANTVTVNYAEPDLTFPINLVSDAGTIMILPGNTYACPELSKNINIGLSFTDISNTTITELTLNGIAKTINLINDFTINNLTLTNGTLNVNTNSLNLTGSVTQTNGTITNSDIGTVKYSSTTNGQNIAYGTYGLLSFNDFNKILPSTGTITIIGSANAFTTGSAIDHIITGSTIDFRGTAAQTIPVFNYNNLIVSNIGNVAISIAGSINVAGDLYLNPSTGIKSWINTSTITLNGSVDQNVATTTVATGPFYNLTINKTAGLVNLESNITIPASRTLTLSKGIIKTNAFSVLAGASSTNISGASASSYIDGYFGWTYASTTAAVFNYYMGSAGIYKPFTFNVKPSANTSTVWTGSVAPNTLTGKTLAAGLIRVSQLSYFMLSRFPTTAFTLGTLKINYTAVDLVTTPATLKIAKDLANVWTDITGTGTGSGTPTGSITSTTTFSNTTMGTGNFILADATGGGNFTMSSTVYVDFTNGNDLNSGFASLSAKKTIAAGLSVLSSAGTLYIASGNYGEHVIINNPIVIIGTGNPTTSGIILNAALATPATGITATTVTVNYTSSSNLTDPINLVADGGTIVMVPGYTYIFPVLTKSINLNQTNNSLTTTISNLTLNAVNKTISLLNNFTVGNLTLTEGTLSVGGNMLSLSGTINQTNGLITSSTIGTIIYNQASDGQNVLASSYGNLTFNNFNKILPSDIIYIAGTFTAGTATGSTISGNSIVFNGSGAQSIPAFNYNNLAVLNTDAVTLANSGTIGIAGIFFPGDALYTVSGSTFNFNGNGSQIVPSFNLPIGYNALQLNSSLRASLDGNVTANSILNLTNLIIGANTLTINGALSSVADGLTGGVSSNIVFGSGGASTNLTKVTLNNLTINRSSGIYLNGDVNVGGILNLTDGNLNVGAFTLTLNGNVINFGLITVGETSKLTFGAAFPSIVLPAMTINDFTINTGNEIILSSNIIVNGVLLLNGPLTVGSNTLQYNSFSGNGSNLKTDNSSSLVIKGTAAGVIIPGGSGTRQLNNLTIDNNNGATLNGAVELKGVLTLTSGILKTNNYLTLLSDASQTALISGTGLGNISGNVTMQRYISGIEAYHNISFPNTVNSTDFTQITDDMTVTGWGAKNQLKQWSNLWKYDETLNGIAGSNWLFGYVAPASQNEKIEPMRGYIAVLAAGSGLEVTGPINHSNVSITTTRTGTNSSQNGFNLIGNPYPSPIDWDAAGWTKINMKNEIHIWHPTGKYVGVYYNYVNGVGTDMNSIISPMQSFWVRVSNGQTTGTITATNAVRTNNLSSGFNKKSAKSDNKQLLQLDGYADFNNELIDKTVIYLDSAANFSFDDTKDAGKVMNNGNNPNLFSIINNEMYSINALPFLSDSSVIVPLEFNIAIEGKYHIKATRIQNFPLNTGIFIEDKLKGIKQDLNVNTDYVFDLTKDNGMNRFYIHLNPDTTNLTSNILNNKVAEDYFKAYINNNILYIDLKTTDNKGKLNIYNVLGENISGDILLTNGNSQYFLGDIKPGVYFISIKTNKKSNIQKIMINR